MIALDTNILIRFLVRDDERQAGIVYKRLKKAEDNDECLFIPLLVVLETIWVLQSAYGLSRQDILSAIDAMRHMAVFSFECENVVERLIVEAGKSKADLADLLIAISARNKGCESILTFDKKAAKFESFQLLK